MAYLCDHAAGEGCSTEGGAGAAGAFGYPDHHECVCPWGSGGEAEDCAAAGWGVTGVLGMSPYFMQKKD